MTKKLCRAELHIGDDEGDNWATMKCGQAAGHKDAHSETYPRGDNKTFVTVSWFGDDRRAQKPGALTNCDMHDDESY